MGEEEFVTPLMQEAVCKNSPLFFVFSLEKRLLRNSVSAAPGTAQHPHWSPPPFQQKVPSGRHLQPESNLAYLKHSKEMAEVHLCWLASPYGAGYQAWAAKSRIRARFVFFLPSGGGLDFCSPTTASIMGLVGDGRMLAGNVAGSVVNPEDGDQE